MDITNFAEEVDLQKEYKYRMLVYGNYTYRDNLEADSLVVVLRNVIPFLSKIRDIHFTLVTPQLIKSLAFPNVEQKIFELPSYCNTMRTHFDATKLLEILDWKRQDCDIIYSHVPEHTAQIANVVYNNTHLRPKIIGYSHWFEVPQNAPYEKTMLPAALFGMLEADEFGVNSDWLKQLVLKEAKKYISDKLINKLTTIIQPHYLGVDRVDNRSKHMKPKTVIFNHRPSGYTGWDWFCDIMDEVWKERQDFTVYTTLAGIDRPWNKKLRAPTRSEYMSALSTMHFGVGCFQKYSAWSISVTDGLSVSVPYLLPAGFCYPEMVGVDYPYLYQNRDEFITLFNKMLDDNSIAVPPNIVSSMMWEDRISKWFGGWDKVFNLKPIRETDTYKGVLDIIQKHRYISKKELLEELGWGIRVKWTPYRNRLRNEPNVVFTKKGYEWTG